MKRNTHLTAIVSFLVAIAIGIVACDSRKNFFDKLIEDNPSLLGTDSAALNNQNPKLSFTGDSLKKVEATNSLKLKFKLVIENATQTSTFFITPELVSGQGTLFFNNRQIPFSRSIKETGKEFEFEFEPNQRQIGVNEIRFLVVNAKNLDLYAEKSIRLRYVDDIAIVQVDKTIAIDDDSSKIGKNYDFYVKLISATPRVIEFQDVNFYDFFEVNLNNTTTPILAGRLNFQAGEQKKIRAVGKLTPQFNSYTTPFEHKSFFTTIRVLVISQLDNNPESGVSFSLLLFDNLPPLPPVISLTIDNNPDSIHRRAKVSYTQAIDRDAKWGGQVTQVRFIGYQGQQEIINTETGQFLGWGQPFPSSFFIPCPRPVCVIDPNTYSQTKRFGYTATSPVLVPQSPSFLDLYSLSGFSYPLFDPSNPFTSITYISNIRIIMQGIDDDGYPCDYCPSPSTHLPFNARFISIDNENASGSVASLGGIP